MNDKLDHEEGVVMNTNNITYKHLQNGDENLFVDLVKLFNIEFESENLDYANIDNIKSLLAKSDFICLVALSENAVIGGLTGFELIMYDQVGSTMYLYDIAVGRAYQRSGIGSRLISELKVYCVDKGITDMYVQADVIDQHAIEFYKKLGGDLSEVVHFSFDFTEEM
jgi:aminoglycoside 3-N-acetyltransferase I